MVSAKDVRNTVGIIGNVISFGLFISPAPTFWRIIKKKDVEEFQPYPYVATVLNCMFWIFYGMPFVTPDSLLVITINAVGLFIEFIYLAIFCFFANNKKRKVVGLALLGEFIFMAIIIVISMKVFPDHKKRSFFVGVWCDVFNVIMYSSPLAIMKKVVQTKSVEFMPLYLSLANFANGCVWTAYSLIMRIDYFILISNGLGAISGLIQLVLYAIYYRTTPKRGNNQGDDTVKPSEIQLSGSGNV